MISVSLKKLQVMLFRKISVLIFCCSIGNAENTADYLVMAFDAMENQDWHLALDLAKKDGRLAQDIVEWHILRAQLGTANAAISFLKRNGDWPGLPYLRKRSEPSFLTASAEQILEYFDEAEPKTAEGSLAYAFALKTLGKTKKANAIIRRAWQFYEMDERTLEYFQKHYFNEIHNLFGKRLYEMLWSDRLDQARALYPSVSTALKNMAITRIALIQGRAGVDLLLSQLPTKLKNDPLISHGRFVWRLKNKKRNAAADFIIEKSLSEKALGRPEVWAEERKNLVRNLMREKEFLKAYEMAANHHLEFGEFYAELEWLSGYISLKFLKNPTNAQEHFEKFLFAVDTPISLGRAYYWLGQAYKAQGKIELGNKAFAAGSQFSTSFYGILSAEEIGIQDSNLFHFVGKLPNWRGAEFRDNSVFEAAKLLFAAEEGDLAERFLTHLAETLAKDEVLKMTHFLEEVKKPHILVMLGKRKASQGISFPRSYFALHPMANGSYPIPPHLALSIARRESEFDPKVISPVGARGIMQLMPRTAREMAGKLGLIYDESRLVVDWKYNTLLGAAYLEELSARFSHNPVLVLIGYNAGPSRVENWIGLLGDPRKKETDIIDWIEMIPFDETRNYVMRVSESLPIYRKRLGLVPFPKPFSEMLQGSGF